jgi:hypothetical protein
MAEIPIAPVIADLESRENVLIDKILRSYKGHPETSIETTTVPVVKNYHTDRAINEFKRTAERVSRILEYNLIPFDEDGAINHTISTSFRNVNDDISNYFKSLGEELLSRRLETEEYFPPYGGAGGGGGEGGAR